MGFLVDFFRSTYGNISKIVLGAGLLLFIGWFVWGQTSSLQKVKTISPDWTQEKVKINDDLTFTDSDGNQTTEDKPEDTEDVEQTITIDTTSHEKIRRLFVAENESWFPEITGTPNARVRGLSGSDVSGVTVTNQTVPLFGTDFDAIMVGPSYSIGGSFNATVAYTPIQIWAFRIGISGNYSVNRMFSLQLAINVEARENLYLTVGATPDLFLGGEDKEVTFGLLYKF